MKKTFTIFLAVIMMVTFMPLDTGSYAFAASVTYESEPNDELWQANEWRVEDGSTFKGTFPERTDNFEPSRIDWIKLTLENTGVWGIESAQGTGKFSVEIYSAPSKDLKYRFSRFTVEYNSNLGYYYKEPTNYALSAGTYYIAVTPETWDSSEYTLKLGGWYISDEIKEPNDFIADASEIKLNKTYETAIAEVSMDKRNYETVDVDFVKLYVPKAGNYYLNCKVATRAYNDLWSGNKRRMEHIIFKEVKVNGEELEQLASFQGASEESGIGYGKGKTLIRLTKGTHYIKIYTEDKDCLWYDFSISPKLSKVSKVKASKLGSGKVNLSWSAKAGADGYRIYRLNPNTGKYAYIGKSKTTSFIDSKARRGMTNSYKVKAYRMKNGSREDGYFSDVVKGKA